MTLVVLGCVADSVGGVSQLVTVAANHRGRNFDVERRFMSSPSTEYRSVQTGTGGEILVDHDHDRVIGTLKYLERNPQRLFAVCEIDPGSLEQGPWYFSPEILHRAGRDIELRALAVTKRPGSVGLGPISARSGTLDEAARSVVFQDGWEGALIRRAREYDRARRHGEPLVIHDTHPPQPRTTAATAPVGRVGPIEFRSATTVDYSRSQRQLDVLIAPAERPTTIVERARHYIETFAHGAFSGCENDPSRVRVNRDHVRERVLGKALRLDPWSEQGLTGTLKLSRTRDADEALALIDDDLLEVSAGFAVPSGGDEWRGTRRRVRRAQLDHVALVAQAAYPSARVTAVRSHHLALN